MIGWLVGRLTCVHMYLRIVSSTKRPAATAGTLSVGRTRKVLETWGKANVRWRSLPVRAGGADRGENASEELIARLKAAEEEAKELKLKLDAVNASNVEVRVCLALLVIVIVFAGGIWGARGSPHLPRVLDRARTSSSSRRLDRPRSSWSSPSWQSPSWQSPHHHARTTHGGFAVGTDLWNGSERGATLPGGKP